MAQDDDFDLSPEANESTGSRSGGRRAVVFALLLALATAASYAPVLENDFTSFDDPQYIVDNPQVRGGLSLEGIEWAFTHAHSDNWHPLTWLSHMADVELFGLDPRGHHAASVLLHALNALLLFALLLRATGKPTASAVVALFFALHPLRVESVAWAAERKDVLSGFFFLATLLAYSRYAERRSTARYSAVFVLFTLGLLAKPMLVTLPVLLLLWDRWPLERRSGIWPTRSQWIEKLPLFALAVGSSLVTLWAQSIGGTVKSLELIPLGDRFLNVGTSVWIYLLQSAWPFDLAFFYPHPALVEGGGRAPFEALGIAGLIAIAIVSASLLRRFGDRPWLSIGWFFWLIALVPVIGIVQVGAQAHADRYTYLPSIGLWMALVFGATHALGIEREGVEPAVSARRSRGFMAIAVAIALGLSFLTAQQVAVWRSSERLYRHALEVTRDNYIAAFNLGALSGGAGDDAGARSFYRMALEMRPDYAAAHNNLGVTSDRLGQSEEAEFHYREALRLDPRLAHAAINLGALYLNRGDHPRAREFYVRAIEIRPDLALPRETLGEFEAKLGNLEEAVRHFEAAVAITPAASTPRTRLADAYASLGREQEAIEQYQAALERDPDQLAAMNALARLLATAGTPGSRDPAAALAWAKRASQGAGGRNPTFLMTLALAHAAAGDEKEAARQRDRAIGFAPAEARQALRALFERYGSANRAPAQKRDRSS